MIQFVYLFSFLNMLYNHDAETDDIRVHSFELQTMWYK